MIRFAATRRLCAAKVESIDGDKEVNGYQYKDRKGDS